eukprot:8630237-Alexandrium_andersonii.AAC.1
MHRPKLSWDSWRRLGVRMNEVPHCAVQRSPGTDSGRCATRRRTRGSRGTPLSRSSDAGTKKMQK